MHSSTIIKSECSGSIIKEEEIKNKDFLGGCIGFNGLLDNSSVYIGPSPKEREKERARIDEGKNV